MRIAQPAVLSLIFSCGDHVCVRRSCDLDVHLFTPRFRWRILPSFLTTPCPIAPRPSSNQSLHTFPCLDPPLRQPPSDSRTSALAEEERVLIACRDPAGNREGIVARVTATLKRVAPLIADARPTKHGSKHRRTNSCTTPTHGGGGGGGGASRGQFFGKGTGNGNSVVEGHPSPEGMDGDGDRLLWERVSRIALETEQVRASRQRAASFADADRDLDEAFLESFGVSLPGSGAADRGASLSSVAARAEDGGVASFDRARVTSIPLGCTEAGVLRSKAEQEELEVKRLKAAATLTPAEYKCWAIREEMDEYRRQEEKMRSEIFNGDPLLPLWVRPETSGPGAGFRAAPR